jgi:ElaB/YqjD/DUF883 family membrane-anchored ribosome-binding protein
MQPNTAYPLDYSKGPTSPESDQPASAVLSAEDLVNHARQYTAKAQDILTNAKPRLEKSLKEQPMVTLAALAAVGFVLGAMWKK